MGKNYLFGLYGLFLLLGLLPVSSLQAQDPILSQYYANRMIYNPALTNYEGGVNFNSHYRNQWVQLGLNAGRRALFETHGFGLSLETPCKDVALGLTYLDNTEGIGDLKWQHFGFATAYKTPVLGTSNGRNPNQWLFGFKVSYNRYSLNPNDNFIFADQLDAYRGLVNPSSAFWTQHPNLPGTGYTDVDMGAAWVVNFKNEDRFRIGASVQHLSRPDKSILGLDDRLGFRPTVHASFLFNDFFDDFPISQFVPSIKVDMQNLSFGRDSSNRFLAHPKYTFWSFQTGAMITAGTLNQIWLGGYLQGRILNPKVVTGPNIYSLITTLGLEMNQNAAFRPRFGVSWDFNLTGIGSDGLGTIEGFIQLNLPTFSFNPNCNCGGRRGKALVNHDPF